MTTNYIQAPAAALGKDIPVDYHTVVNGHTVRTTGTVQKIRRTGKFQIEVTLKHRRTGQIHVNTMDARATVYVFATFLQDGYTEEVQKGLPGHHAELAEIWSESLGEQLEATLKDNMWTFAGLPIEA
jgi:hypothetical protein